MLLSKEIAWKPQGDPANQREVEDPQTNQSENVEKPEDAVKISLPEEKSNDLNMELANVKRRESRQESRRKSRRESKRESKRESMLLALDRSGQSLFCSTVWLAIILTGYLVLGAIVFRHLEWKEELKERTHVKKLRETHMAKLYNLNTQGEERMRLLDKTLKDFERELFLEVKKLKWDGNEDEDVEMHWTFASSIFFCVTILTTIGFGNIIPVTDYGKLFTILYGLVGIPLNLLFLANLAAILAKLLQAWVRGYNGCLSSCCSGQQKQKDPSSPLPSSPRHNSNDLQLGFSSSPAGSPNTKQEFTFKDDPPKQVEVPCVLTIIIMLWYLFLGATLFYISEDKWSFIDSFYFCFTTLTTIGLGDFVFGSDVLHDEPAKLMVCLVYIMFGLAIITMSFALLQERVLRGVRESDPNIRGTLGDLEDEE